MFKLIIYIFIFYLVYQFIKIIVILTRSKSGKEYTFKDAPGKTKNGETTIQYIPEGEKQKLSNSVSGDDYIDYKEVKEVKSEK